MKCSMRAEALPGVGGWESAVSPPRRTGSQAKGFGEIEVDNVSFITIAKSEGNAELRILGSGYARCAVCVEKASLICFFFIFSLLQLHYHFAVIYVMLHTNNFQFQRQPSFSH